MDPKANLKEQLEIAERIQAREQAPEYDFDDVETKAQLDDAARLAELVLALNEWRLKGGFDPYK